MSKRVLIVEDEHDVASLIEEVLELEGFQSQIATGENALQHAIVLRPHVVLLDLMMPVVDGFEVARRLRGNPETRDIPIVVMTAMPDPASRVKDLGASHVLPKPFDINHLINVIRITA